jgi:hypothetical protein
MMIKSSIEKLSTDVGFDIGNSDDVTQSNLLNGFCKGLSNSMNKQALDTQLCYIVDKLDDNSIEVLSALFEFIELKVNKD